MDSVGLPQLALDDRDRGWTVRLPAAVRRHADLILPAVLLVVQLGAALATSLHGKGQQAHLGIGDWILLFVGPLALIFRRRHPIIVLWAALAASQAPSGSWAANLSLIAAFFTAATAGHRQAAWTAIVVGYIGSVWLSPLVGGQSAASLQFALLLFAWLAVLVVSAEVVRMRGERVAQARTERRLEARRRASEERLRIARELHDVIGHNISLINIQAGVGLDLMDSQPGQTRAALTAIRAVSKEALGELRAMLAALRETGADAPRSPVPGVDRLPALVASTQAAGLHVATEVVGQERPLPPAVDLAAYRIIQESLTNVARHARGGVATVRLTYADEGLLIEILDDGGGTAAVGNPAPDTHAATGSGILNMRERAAALGGELTAEPGRNGGFAVTVGLPLRNQT